MQNPGPPTSINHHHHNNHYNNHHINNNHSDDTNRLASAPPPLSCLRWHHYSSDHFGGTLPGDSDGVRGAYASCGRAGQQVRQGSVSFGSSERSCQYDTKVYKTFAVFIVQFYVRCSWPTEEVLHEEAGATARLRDHHQWVNRSLFQALKVPIGAPCDFAGLIRVGVASKLRARMVERL